MKLAVAGGLAGRRPLQVVNAILQPLVVPAQSEFHFSKAAFCRMQTISEGPFGEFIGYLSPVGDGTDR